MTGLVKLAGLGLASATASILYMVDEPVLQRARNLRKMTSSHCQFTDDTPQLDQIENAKVAGELIHEQLNYVGHSLRTRYKDVLSHPLTTAAEIAHGTLGIASKKMATLNKATQNIISTGSCTP